MMGMAWDIILQLLVAFGIVAICAVVGGIGIAITMIVKEKIDDKYR